MLYDALVNCTLALLTYILFTNAQGTSNSVQIVYKLRLSVIFGRAKVTKENININCAHSKCGVNFICIK